ncbi:MAG: GxxExxY protein [Bacteroidota bacterium]|jgi:GxxExxY protein|nr:GxxExxY protein [Bacteroidota bacterium]
MQINDLTYKIIGCAYTVHSELGPGLLESTYRTCLAYELVANGLRVEVEKALPLRYKDVDLNAAYRIDLLVEDRVVVELKAVDALHEVHKAQLLTYLRLSGKTHGLLFNFNGRHLKDNIVRFINTPKGVSSSQGN